MARRIDVIRIESGNSRGTGFLIDDDRVLTALHVVGKIQKDRLAFHGRDLVLTAAISEGSSLRFPLYAASVEDIEFDERLDWACIHVRGALSGAARLPVGELTESDQSAPWHTYGFPGSNPNEGKATTGVVASPTAALRMGGMRVSAIQLFSQEAGAGVGGTVHGYSGAPVIVDNRVVGILCTADVHAETGRAEEGTLYAIPLTALEIALPAVECPYPGLRPFDAKDALRFFGRGAEIEQVLERLRRGERQILVVGPSGSGKSSFVKAGVIPQLSKIDASFDVRILQPGARPYERLLHALDDAASPGEGLRRLLAKSETRSILLVIDQLEELFTQCDSRDERQRFADGYLELLGDRRCAFIVAVRADFYGDLIDSALWSHLSGRSFQLELAPLRGRQLVEAIEAPARALGIAVETGLRERLIADAASEPGALPLLQVTLRSLWEKRGRSALSLDDYIALGDARKSGLAVALEHMADAVLHGISMEQQVIARRIFLRLVNFGEGRASTRRQQSIPALATTADDERHFRSTLDELTNGKLLTRDIKREGEEFVEVVDMAHEALIGAWPTLAGWIAARHADEQRRRTLEEEVRQWTAHGRGDVALLDAVQVAEAEAWVRSDAARDVGFGKDLTDFLMASRRTLDERARRRRRRTRLTIAVLTVFSIAVSALAFFASNRARAAKYQASIAEVQKTAAQRTLGLTYLDQGRQLVVDGYPQQALPLLVAAREQGIDSAALKMLLASASFRPTVTVGHSAAVLDANVSPDGKYLVTASKDHTARVWDIATGKPIGSPLRHADTVRRASFSPDSTRVVTASADKTARIWDAVTGEAMAPAMEHGDELMMSVFSPDGTRVATASEDKTARIWDAATGNPVTPPMDHDATVRFISFSSDGKRVVTATSARNDIRPKPAGRSRLTRSPTTHIWDAVTGQRIHALTGYELMAFMASFSPDGRHVLSANSAACMWNAEKGGAPTRCFGNIDRVTASFDPAGTSVVAGGRNTAQVWEVATGEPVTPPLEHRDVVLHAAFNWSGNWVATASKDGTARVWDAQTGTPITPWLEHLNTVRAVVFTPNGEHLVTASGQSAHVWPLRDATRSLPLPHQGQLNAAAISSDGTHVVSASSDHTARVWSTSACTPETPPLQHQFFVEDAAFSPDGKRVVTASLDRTARVWDAATGTELTPPLEHRHTVMHATFSPDGKRILTMSQAGTRPYLWDATTGTALAAPFEHAGRLYSASFSPDGNHIVTASEDGTARVWAIATGSAVTPPLEHRARVLTAAFSPDGRRVITGSNDGTARIWDVATGKPITQSLEHHASVNAVSFSPDGRHALTASSDRTARVWDATTGAALLPPLEHKDAVNLASFSADGAFIVTGSDDRVARVWDATTGRALTPPLGQRNRVYTVQFSPNGEYLVTSGRVWSLPRERASLAQLQERLRCSSYELANGIVLSRSPPETCVTK